MGLTDEEVRKVRELLDCKAIQDNMLRYVRAADRQDPDLFRTIFWDDGTDDHGMYRGLFSDFWELSVGRRERMAARHHLTSPVAVRFVSETQAKVETYFHFVGVLKGSPDTFGVLAGRYRDVFEKRSGEWRVLRRVVIYDWTQSYPYEPAWDFWEIPEGHNRGAHEPVDATYDREW